MPYILGAAGASVVLARRAPVLSLGSAAFALACTAFFRDPEVSVRAGDEDVLSAADGVVMAVDRIHEPWWIEGEADRIAVFLSVLDVHVNRWPVAGRLAKVKRVPGRFSPAFLHGEHNCKDLLAVEGDRGPLLIAQISGVLARRSVQWTAVGDRFAAGDRLGMIRFGSRTDVYLPAGTARILVKEGERVRGAQTVIARYLD
jgi:phosphatidylserine decarboxylase